MIYILNNLGEVGGTVCLFCPATYVDKDDLLNHMLEVNIF